MMPTTLGLGMFALLGMAAIFFGCALAAIALLSPRRTLIVSNFHIGVIFVALVVLGGASLLYGVHRPLVSPIQSYEQSSTAIPLPKTTPVHTIPEGESAPKLPEKVTHVRGDEVYKPTYTTLSEGLVAMLMDTTSNYQVMARRAEADRPAPSTNVSEASDTQAEARAITKQSTRDMGLVGEAVKNLPSGSASIRAPKAMMVNDTRRVSVRLGVDVPEEILNFAESQDSQVASVMLKASYDMKASLNGAAFSVKPVNADRQKVVKGVPTEWEWDVTAIDAGRQAFKVYFYVVLQLSQGEVEKLYISKDHEIQVDVRPQTFTEWMKTITDGLNTAGGMVTALIALASSVGTIAAMKFGVGMRAVVALLVSFKRRMSS